MPCDLALPEEAGEYVRTARLLYKEATSYAEAGEEFCFGQSVETVEKTEPEFGCGTEPEVVEGDFSLSIVGTGFRLTFDKVTGKLVACKIGKKSLCMMASIR